MRRPAPLGKRGFARGARACHIAGHVRCLPSRPRRRPRVRRLILRDFRSYAALDVRFDAGLVAFVGENGAGKTNLLGGAVAVLARARPAPRGA